MTRPIVKGAYAMEQMQSAVSGAANSIDMHVAGPSNITLFLLDDNNAPDVNHPFLMPAWMYVNSDDGVLTISLPSELPQEIRQSKNRRFLPFFFDAITNPQNPVELEANLVFNEGELHRARSWTRISESSLTNCFLFVDDNIEANRIFLFIDDTANRIGSLVLDKRWTTFRFLRDHMPTGTYAQQGDVDPLFTAQAQAQQQQAPGAEDPEGTKP